MSESIIITLIVAIFTFLGIIFPIIFKKLTSIHNIVNGSYGLSLQVGATALRKIADASKLPADIEAATYAEKLLSNHEASQAKLDSK